MTWLAFFVEVVLEAIVIVLVESFLVVSVVATLVHHVVLLVVLMLLIVMPKESEVALILKWRREVNWCQRGVERLCLRGGERVPHSGRLAAPRLESTLAVEAPGGVGRTRATLDVQVQGTEYVALVFALKEISQNIVCLVRVPDLSGLFREQIRLIERCFEVEADIRLRPLFGFLSLLLDRIGELQVEVEVCLGRVVDAIHH